MYFINGFSSPLDSDEDLVTVLATHFRLSSSSSPSRSPSRLVRFLTRENRKLLLSFLFFFFLLSNNPMSYPNVASMNQPMTTMYNALANGGNVMSSHVNHMRQFYGGQRSSSSLMPHHQQQQQQLQQHAQQQQQHMMASAQAQQQQYGGPPMTNGGGVVGSNARITNTQQRNALRTAVTVPASEIIDLSSPPSSPGLSTQPSDSISVSPPWDLKRIAERQWGSSESSHNIAYKVNNNNKQ